MKVLSSHVEFAEQHQAKIHFIAILLNGLQSDQLVAQYFTDKDEAALSLDVPEVSHTTYRKAVLIDRLRDRGWVTSRAGHLDGSRGREG